ncbi:MAG TPA: M20/M25/M40 family metallo-hydrolase [Candidatus Limnocylindrales bacterium]|nr:M20/M25/M40 family metallo-hydrolase [Candidatus Limnocylindrales bacterium]
MRRAVALIFVVACALPVLAQENPASRAAHQWRQGHERQIVEEFVSLLSIPDVSADRANIQRNAEAIAEMMRKRGIEARLVSVPGANPVVFGEIRTPGATRTIVFYAHYDGQPVDPKQWATAPFTPTLRDGRVEEGGKVISLPAEGSAINSEWRIYARAAGDDKAPIEAMMTALDAIRAAGLKTKSNIKFVFEGEEEAGSINLEKILAANKDLFAGDVWLICDGPVSQTRQQSIAFGARGIAEVEITVYGPRVELHSGHYGNWAPNPAMMLAHLLASMKDEQGHVLIDHFYDGIEPLSETEKRALAEAPKVDAQLMKEFWLGSTEGAPKTLAELITMPSLNIRGMASGHVGAQASNVVPATATASIDMRLVKGMDADKTAERLIEHVRKQGFFVVDHEPTEEERTSHAKVARVVIEPGGYNSVRTPMDLPISQEVIRTAESARGPVVKIPIMGGSVPLDMIERTLGTHTIIVPIANHDDNQHSFNENLRIQNLWDGVDLMAALLTM